MYLVKIVNTETGRGYIESFKTAKRAKEAVEVWNSEPVKVSAEYLGEETRYYAKEKQGLVPKIG